LGKIDQQTVYIFGDSFAIDVPKSWPLYVKEAIGDRYSFNNHAHGGASNDYSEYIMRNQGLKRKDKNTIGMFFISHPRRLWLQGQTDVVIQGQDVEQLRFRAKNNHKASVEQLKNLYSQRLVDQYEGAYYLVGNDKIRWERELRKILCSINHHARLYKKFFVFFSFEDSLHLYRQLDITFNNLDVIDRFAMDSLNREDQSFFNSVNHLSRPQRRGFAKVMIDCIEKTSFDYSVLNKEWRQYDYLPKKGSL